MEDYIDKVLAGVKKDLSNPNPPKVVRDSHNKKISVTCDFALGKITKVKFIASYEKWVELFYEWDFDQLSFDDLEPYLSRLCKDKRAALKEYSIEYPGPFVSDVFECVESALSENPLFKAARKSRNPSRYGLQGPEKNELSMQAACLYVFLGRMSGFDENDWPDYFKRFCETYDMGFIDIRKPLDRQAAVRKIMSIYKGGDPDYFEERFFQTFVTESPIKLLRIKKSSRLSPANDPFLKSLFQEFI